MKVTYHWIREFVDTELPPAELADRLTMAGLEVERLEPLGASLGDIRVARVRAVRRHPNADRLSLCEVEGGDGVAAVVCGAPNVHEGAFVPFAPIGATLPDGTQIRKAKLRGEVSEGMLLSEAELGLSSNHDGLLLLDGEPRVGARLVDLLGLDDWLFEISLTPNRSDCLGVLGIAREVAALTGARLDPPPTEVAESDVPAARCIRVEVEDPTRCTRYAARVVHGVRVGPSPLAVRLRLGAVGVRSISNVVDATNLVLLERGHPLHAFDLAKVGDRRILVRRARAGEKLTTLDGAKRTLSDEDLVIADGRAPMALAGIMGGEDSGVHGETVDVVLESAHFEPVGIRRSARRHGLHTEASHRFERGTDPLGTATALNRLARRVTELAGGAVARGIVEVVARPHVAPRVAFRPARARSLIGVDVDPASCSRALESIGVRVAEAVTGDGVEATIPSWRPDLEREVDLIEEIARLVGYDRIPAATVAIGGGSGARLDPSPADRGLERARDVLSNLGYREVIRLAFTSPEAIERFAYPDGRAEPVRIANPLGEDGSVLATSLLPGLVESARFQLNQGASTIRLFQAGRVHRRSGGKWPYREISSVAAVGAGARGLGAFPESATEMDLFDLKGTLEILAETLGMKGVAFRATTGLQYAEPGHAGELWWNDRKLGEILMFATGWLASFGVDTKLFGFELELSGIEAESEPTYRPFSRLPAALRDLAIEVPEEVPAGDVQSAIATAGSVREVELFDVYRGAGLGEGRKSLAFHIRLQHPERSLTETEVGTVLDQIVRDLESSIGAKRR